MKMTTTSENDMQQIYVPKTARARGQKWRWSYHGGGGGGGGGSFPVEEFSVKISEGVDHRHIKLFAQKKLSNYPVLCT